MLLYFYLLGGSFLRERMRPALTEAWRRRSFTPCRALCDEVVARAARTPPDDSVMRQAAQRLPFAREFWHALAGELLVYGCEDLPLIQTAPASLCCLLAAEHRGLGDLPRGQFAAIHQVHFGSRDLRFGGAFYRPDRVGINDEGDVARLLLYLEGIDAGGWQEKMLCPMPEFASAEERAEELAFVRDWWPALVEMYRGALTARQVIVCEQL
jgi:hypothetical protein